MRSWGRAHLEHGVLDLTVHHAHLQLHHISARRRTHQARPHLRIILVKRSHVAWRLVVVDDGLVVRPRRYTAEQRRPQLYCSPDGQHDYVDPRRFRGHDPELVFALLVIAPPSHMR